MYLRHRHRRGAYPLAAERQLPRVARPLLLLAAVILLGFLVRSAFRSWISADAARAGAELFTEDRGTVSVIIEEKEQRAENGMTLLPGETVRTGASARAGLRFFDGTRMRLGEGTELTIDESSKGEQARITLTMKQGTLWMQTPSAVTFSGAVQRVITTPSLTFTVPGGTDAAFTALSLAVFSSEEVGVDTGVEGRDSFVIGEGQQWSVPSGGEIAANPYEHRSPIDSASALSAFAQESRRKMGASSGVPVSSGAAAASELLTVTSPKNGAVNDPVITVQGTIGDGVVSVLINGQPALVDAAKRTFSQQVSPPEGTAEFEITVRALDANKTVLSEIRRAVTRSTAASLNPPTVTTPAKTGQTYRTAREELILRGTSPAGAVGIMVNDYRLQLFDPAKGEWSYIASTRLGNLFSGTNVYDVYAIDAQGRKSAAARLTIILSSEGGEGVISETTSSTVTSTGPLPSNAPLLPGSLQVTAPTAGTTHTETGTGFLLEGITSAQTASISVNDYTLQLYKTGKTTWNYIVDVAFNNLKAGKNTYVVVARNSKGEILDRMTYEVEYVPTND